MRGMSEEITHYVRLKLMLTDIARELLPKVFKHLIKKENITDFLSSEEQQQILKELFKKTVINKSEYILVCRQDLNLERFDISLWIKLILNLCKDNIPEPQCGWKTKPNPKDESLGADLLRLGDARNKIIGHRPDAKLSKGEYDVKWKKLTDILLRVVERVDSESRNVFEGRINEYKELHVCKVKTLQDNWLQEKVEELIKNSQEFQVYFEATFERFVRYIKLLFYGGCIVLCGMLETKLGDQDLLSVLERKKITLSGNIEEKFSSCIFSQGSCSDYKNRDVFHLASVLLRVCNDDLNQDEIKYIMCIQNARINYATLASQSFDTDEFISNWTDLLLCLNHLSINIPEDKRRQVDSLIERYKNKDKEGCDAEEYIKQLREFGVADDVYNETITELRDMLNQLGQESIKLKQEHFFKFILLTTCENEETKKVAKDLLKKCLQASIQKSNEQQSPLEKELEKLLASVSSDPDVTSVQENRKRKNQYPVN